MSLLNWPDAKDPDESYELQFDWGKNRLLVGQTIVNSTFIVVGSATLVISHQVIAGGFTTFRVSGGARGDVARITNRVVLSNSDIFDQTSTLRIRPK